MSNQQEQRQAALTGPQGTITSKAGLGAAAFPGSLMTRSKRLALALLVNLALVAAQVIAGLQARSLALVSDGAHNLLDAAAIVATLLAWHMATRPHDAKRSFGFHRATILAALANALWLLVAIGVLSYEAALRISHPVRVDGALVGVVAAGAVLANVLAAWMLHEPGHELSMSSLFVHLAGDSAVAGVVLASGLVEALDPSVTLLDPAVTLAVSAMLAWQGYRLLRQATEILLESSPSDVDLSAIKETVLSIEGVEAVHDLHTWSLSSEVRAMSAHLVLSGHPSLEEAQATASKVKSAIAQPFGFAHATLELECESCVEPGEDPCTIEPASHG